jgi:hypothetical protein
MGWRRQSRSHLRGVTTRRLADVPAERGAEGARRGMADEFGDRKCEIEIAPISLRGLRLSNYD